MILPMYSKRDHGRGALRGRELSSHMPAASTTARAMCFWQCSDARCIVLTRLHVGCHMAMAHIIRQWRHARERCLPVVESICDVDQRDISGVDLIICLCTAIGLQVQIVWGCSIVHNAGCQLIWGHTTIPQLRGKRRMREYCPAVSF